MDGITSTDGILFIAATNNLASCDSAVLRPGRFDRQIAVLPPTNDADCQAIISVHLLGKVLHADTSLDEITPFFHGLTGAEIEGVLNESVIESLRTGGGGTIRISDIDAAIMKHYTKGVVRGDSPTEERERVAAHEAGHALMCLILGRSVIRASIRGYGATGGAVISKTPNTVLKTTTELREEICICYAGLVGERLLYDVHSTGCTNDIDRATSMITTMVDHAGMGGIFTSTKDIDINSGIKNDVAKVLEMDTHRQLSEHLEQLKALQQRLLRDETLFSLNTINDVQGPV
jgi:cell division protease FtsH